ncbi:hypothetical protein HII31_04072 [Pseudocercospora fuligena]|uniref:Uncharacterized protein n=1 Tax=Pseudocercospora fuligena TaxID=685502 RepID=A0A8H6RLG1_9PEZI|nr:hypothetical protein HII31_04072 [Pseudocercospora fuligena]
MPPAPPATGFLSLARSSKSDGPTSDLYLSSLELDEFASKLVRRDAQPDAGSPAKPLNIQVRAALAPRAATTFHPGAGTKPPQDFNNNGFFALFAILGAAMVVASIWFFFWAKNGGFQWRQGDWDDYKSTVLRRKGPDGKTLSNATKSTKLGGGTIAGTQSIAWAKHHARSVVGKDEKGRKGILAQRGWGKTHSVTYKDDFTDYTTTYGTRTVTDEMTELRTEADTEYHGPAHGHHSKRYRDRDVKQYKKEKPARVGGMNRVADSEAYDSSAYDRSDVMTETVLSESSNQNLLPKRDEEKEKERAERRARHEAAKMERRWKRDAEEAAAALAREASGPPPPPPVHASTRKSSSPSKPASARRNHRDRASSRSASPKKRDFSYTAGPESEILTTAYTESSGTRTASYYDEYRPRASENPRYSSEYRSTRQSSPKKKDRGARSGGYRRGGQDSDLE